MIAPLFFAKALGFGQTQSISQIVKVLDVFLMRGCFTKSGRTSSLMIVSIFIAKLQAIGPQ